MTFKEYITTSKGKKELKNYLKKNPHIKQKIERMKKRSALPHSKESRHMDSSNMGVTSGLPAATQGNQPSMS
jgi:DNA-binding PadR family transcriptional regulator